MPSRALHSSRSCAAVASSRLASAPAASSASRSLTCLRSSLSSARASLSLATAARSFCSAASAAAALSSAAASALSRSSAVFSRSSHPPRSSRICSTCWHSSVRSASSAVRVSISACSDERAAACGSRTRIHQSTRTIAAARPRGQRGQHVQPASRPAPAPRPRIAPSPCSMIRPALRTFCKPEHLQAGHSKAVPCSCS